MQNLPEVHVFNGLNDTDIQRLQIL